MQKCGPPWFRDRRLEQPGGESGKKEDRKESIEYKLSFPVANWMNYNSMGGQKWGCDTNNPGMNDIGQGHMVSLVTPLRADKSEGKVRPLSCRLPRFVLLTGSSQPCQTAR